MNKEKLSVKNWIGYGCGDLGGVLTFGLMNTIVTRYYTNVLNIDMSLLAILLLIWNIWDAVNDPLMGLWMDKTFLRSHNSKGKFRPWILRSAPLVFIFAIAFWSVPTCFEGITRIVVLFLAKILYEGAYTMFNIPMGTLLSAMARNDEERASLSSARGVGSAIGTVIPTILAPIIMAHFGEDNPTAYLLSGILCASLGLIFSLLHYFWTEERNTEFLEQKTSEEELKIKDIFDLFRYNKAFVALCIHGICICTMQYVSSTLGTYMYADVLGKIELMSYGTVASIPFMLLIYIFVPKLCKKHGLLQIVRLCLVAGAFVYIGLFGLHLVMNVNGYVHVILSAIATGLGSVSIYMQWGLVGNAIDYNEKVTGKRTEGTIYGTFNLTRRVGQTLGNSAAVLALSLVGYNASASVQGASTIFGIKVLCVLVPALFLLGSWAAFRFVWKEND